MMRGAEKSMKNMKRLVRWHRLPFVVALCALVLAGCGYKLYTRDLLPFDAIAIGTIENKTHEPKLEDRFNRMLAETFAQYGYRIAPSAPYSLEGEITRFKLTPRAEQNLVATQYEVVIEATFQLIDREHNRSIPLIAGSPFITSFGSTGKIETVLAQKELATLGAMRNIAEDLARRITYSLPSKYASLLFTSADIRDPEGLAAKLREGRDPLSAYLHELLSPETRRRLDTSRPRQKEAPAALPALLAGELNRILQGESIYNEQRFALTALSDRTKRLIEGRPTGAERIPLNRALLEDAYPAELARASKAP